LRACPGEVYVHLETMEAYPEAWMLTLGSQGITKEPWSMVAYSRLLRAHG
jgi:hypothetical protein